MSLYTKIGMITRALPTEEGTEIKLQTEAGAILLDIPMTFPNLRDMASYARFNNIEVSLRHTEDGTVVSLNPTTDQVAA